MTKTSFIFCLLLILLFCNIQCQMTEEKRRNLFSKVVKKIEGPNINDFIEPLEGIYYIGKKTYDPNKIKEIIQANNFPESYNFFEDFEYNGKKPTKVVKNQGNCGCCWAFASSTALAYRYFRKGIVVDLSPQNLLNCHVRNCEAGGFLLDSQFYLVNDGTTTESCIPYKASDGRTINSCPTKCSGNEEFKKYYSKNAYATTFDFDDLESYYDTVTVIMDQLVNFGPVVSGISCYKDLQDLGFKSTCKNTIYKYDGTSKFLSGHAVVIVGYGYQDSKYYWLIQNSWGERFCDGGLAKIEFTEIYMENVGFSDPYIESEIPQTKPKITSMSVEPDCKISYTTDTNNYDMNFMLNFKREDSNNEFNYQCGKDPFTKEEKGICSFAFESYNKNDKGYYQFKNSSFIKTKDNIDLPSASPDRLDYYGNDRITFLFVGGNNLYVSEEGSRISLFYTNNLGNTNLKSKIYPYKGAETGLSNCKVLPNLKFSDTSYLLHCKLTQNEVNIIEKNTNNLDVVYNVLCGDEQRTDIFVHKLDKTKYPVFRVKNLVLPKEKKIQSDSKLTLITNIEGSISGMKGIKDNSNGFGSLIRIISNNKYTFYQMSCLIPTPSKLQQDFEIPCSISTENTINYDSVELTRYYSPFTDKTPFEIIINGDIKAEEYNDFYEDPEPIIPTRRSESKFIQCSLLLLLFLVFAY